MVWRKGVVFGILGICMGYRLMVSGVGSASGSGEIYVHEPQSNEPE